MSDPLQGVKSNSRCFTYISQRTGPNLVPCGQPTWILRQSEKLFLKTFLVGNSVTMSINVFCEWYLRDCNWYPFPAAYNARTLATAAISCHIKILTSIHYKLYLNHIKAGIMSNIITGLSLSLHTHLIHSCWHLL